MNRRLNATLSFFALINTTQTNQGRFVTLRHEVVKYTCRMPITNHSNKRKGKQKLYTQSDETVNKVEWDFSSTIVE